MRISLVLLGALALPAVHADIRPSALFSDNAVLQQGADVPVWGFADDGEKVTVTYAGRTVSTVAENGRWRVVLQNLQPGEPGPLTMAGTNTVVANNVVVGEVWLCSGQSNMARTVIPPESVQPRRPYWAEDAAKADRPMIRHFRTQLGAMDEPADDVAGKWEICTPETVGGFTAVGYYFARDLQDARGGVPVGLINSSVGATGAASWTSRETLAGDPQLNKMLERQERAKAEYAGKLAQYQADEPRLLADYEAALAKAKAEGSREPRKPSPPRNPFTDAYRPTGYYNSKIAPLAPFALRGVLWYQGESDSGQSRNYGILFPAMIANWRALWSRPDLPFLFVQLPEYKGTPPEMRDVQRQVAEDTPHTGMVVTIDVGDAGDIHPPDKRPVGARLALLARERVYGGQVTGSGPLIDEAQASDGKVVLTFKHVGEGLVAKTGDLVGFEIAGANKKFSPARAAIVGDTVVLTGADIAEPRHVRYAWANVPTPSLYNRADLPASPFEVAIKTP